MYRCILLVACAVGASVADPEVVLLQLSTSLPAMAEFAASPDQIVANEYHAPIGIPEAARIADAERAMPEDGAGDTLPDQRPGVMIVGGLASYRGEHPFMAGLVISLTSGSTSVCGGSLISATRVLTAASCYWDGVSQASSMLVVLGSVTLFSGGTRVYAPSIAVHAGYSPAALHYDLAVLTIPYQTSTSYVKPIVLASGSAQYDGYRAEAIGFGRTTNSAPITTSASMRDVFVDVLSNAACAAYYGSDVITASTVCASGAGGRSPCGGDQGGPLILYSSAGNDLQLGVYTFGSTAGCEAGHPSGYMRVTYFYNWIYAQL